MATALDVKRYVRERLPKGGTVKDMKLVTLSFAGHIHWHGEELFNEHICPWEMGYAVAEVFDRPASEGSSANLTPAQKSSIDRIIRIYGHMSGGELKELTHTHDPWINARKGVTTTRTTKRIMPADIAEFYDRTHALEFDEMRTEMAVRLSRVL